MTISSEIAVRINPNELSILKLECTPHNDQKNTQRRLSCGLSGQSAVQIVAKEPTAIQHTEFHN